jgi:hypothetical protein
VNENTEVRDELARLAGWRFVQFTSTASFPHWIVADDDEYPCLDAEGEYVHPIPNTLDEAAKIGGDWMVRVYVNQHGVTIAHATNDDAVFERTGDTELAARFALRLAVEKIEHERKAK